MMLQALAIERAAATRTAERVLHDYYIALEIRSGQKSTPQSANDAGALLAVRRAGLREAVVRHVVGFFAECVLDALGGALAIVGADRLFDKPIVRASLVFRGYVFAHAPSLVAPTPPARLGF